jgi:hypothetical protein
MNLPQANATSVHHDVRIAGCIATGQLETARKSPDIDQNIELEKPTPTSPRSIVNIV